MFSPCKTVADVVFCKAGKSKGARAAQVYDMQKDLFFGTFGRSRYAAVTEGGKLAEFHLDALGAPHITGSIFKGRVVNVLSGMQAAFVNFGQEKNGYLSTGDIPAEAEGGDFPAELTVREGDTVMVQVAKAPMGSKGARLTMNLSFVGKNLIFLPTASFCAISRKIEEGPDRARMERFGKKLLTGGGGFVLRTNARHALLRTLKEEAAYLRALYASACEAYEEAFVGDMVYSDGDVFSRVLRDFDLSEIGKIRIGDEECFRRVDKLLKMARAKGKVERYTGERELLDAYGLEEQVRALARSRVDLENGAYLVFDKTEALTAIDVNTGKYTGATDLENTVFTTNLIAAAEIARQVRLRNIGGIVVVDFIDMADPEHRAVVVAELERCLREDRAKCNLVPMSELGLVQFTRKKVRSDNVSTLTKPCPYCRGRGAVLSDAFIAFRIQSELKRCFAEGHRGAIVELNAGMSSFILSSRCMTAAVRGEWKDKRIYLIPHRTYHDEFFTVRPDDSDVLTLPENAVLLY